MSRVIMDNDTPDTKDQLNFIGVFGVFLFLIDL